jgi:aspartate racemase
LKFQKLSFYLGQVQPIYTLRYGMAEPPGKPVLLPSVEELAAHFIQEMQTVQPYGPYYLLGWSFGGLVAYEIAHQLIAQGQKVALLAVLDTHIEYRIPFVARVLLRCKQRLKRIYDLFRYALRLTPAEFWKRAKRKVKSKFHRPTKVGVQPEYFPHTRSDPMHLVLNRAYARKPYSGKVTLFKAIDSIDRYEYSEPPEVGWKKLITGTLEIHPIPGSHGGILEEPNVQVLADKLQYCIDQTLSG